MTRSIGHRGREQGFTMIELLLVTAIMGVVLAIAGTALVSMMNASNRGNATIGEEQQANITLANLAHDIRSAHTVVIPSGATVTNQVDLQVNNPSGPCTSPNLNPDYPSVTYQPVQWLYTPGTGISGTLSRQILDCNNNVLSTGPTLRRVVNAGSSQYLFKYLNQFGTDITTALPGAIQSCTTRIAVDLWVATNVQNVKPFEVKENVAITDQTSLLSQPGNGQC